MNDIQRREREFLANAEFADLKMLYADIYRERREQRKRKAYWTDDERGHDVERTRQLRVLRAEIARRKLESQQRLPGF
jgi:hypothetical protein